MRLRCVNRYNQITWTCWHWRRHGITTAVTSVSEMHHRQSSLSSMRFVNLSPDTEVTRLNNQPWIWCTELQTLSLAEDRPSVLYSGLLRCKKVDLPPVTTFEALCTKFKVGCSAWLLLTIYRPGSSHPTSTFFCELAAVLETLVTHGCPVIIGGDISIHVENQSDVDAACLLELLESVDLQQHVTSITHKAGGTLDLVITFNDCGVEQLKVDPFDVISDHSLIICTVPFHRPAAPSLTRRVRSCKNVDRAQLRQLIVDSSLSRPLPPTATVDKLFQTYDDTLRSIADQLTPERTINCRLRLLSPWFDDECRAIRRNCRHLERRYRRTHDPADKAAYTAASRDKHSFFD